MKRVAECDYHGGRRLQIEQLSAVIFATADITYHGPFARTTNVTERFNNIGVRSRVCATSVCIRKYQHYRRRQCYRVKAIVRAVIERALKRSDRSVSDVQTIDDT